MRYTRTPKQYEPFYIADLECYCRAKFGYADNVPQNDDLVEIKIQMIDNDEIIICAAHKQEYAHKAYQSRDMIGIADTMLRTCHWRNGEKSTVNYSDTTNSGQQKTTADNSDTPSLNAENKPRRHGVTDIAKAPKITKTTAGYLVKGSAGVVNLYQGEAFATKAIDKQTGEVKTESFKGLKSLHKGYRRMEDKALYTLKANKTVFVTLNFDSKFDFDGIKKVGANLQKWIRRNYSGANGIMVYQPCEDGSWHIHFLLCHNAFCREKRVDNFKRALKEWGEKYNVKKSDKMLDVKHLPTNKEIMIKWAYLDPNHHRERAIYYPVGRQVFKQIGKLKSPPKPIITTNSAFSDFIKKIEARELACFNQQKIFSDSEGYQIRTVDYSYYSISLKRIRDIRENIPKNKILRKEKHIKNRDSNLEQLCLFAPTISRLSSDEIYYNT